MCCEAIRYAVRRRHKEDIIHAVDFFTQFMTFQFFPNWRQNEHTKDLRKQLYEIRYKGDFCQPKPIQGAVRFSSWNLLFSASYMCTHSQCVNLSSGSNKSLFVLQMTHVIPSRNEQSAEQEILQLEQQAPLTDMRQLLGGFIPPRSSCHTG